MLTVQLLRRPAGVTADPLTHFAVVGDATTERSKRNGRSINSEIVQILQETLDIDRAIAESNLVDFDSTQAAFEPRPTPEEKEEFLKILAKKDPFTADILHEGEEHARKLAAIPGRRMGYLDDDK